VSARIELVLPLPPNLANARMHWRVKLKAKKAYTAALNMLSLARKIPRAPAEPLSGVTLAGHLYLWSFMDDDNALARIKWAADWLKGAGYIVDDKRPHCRFTIPEQTVDRKSQRLVLSITPLSSEAAA
jgi:hypothetical protein